jgi:hypothetical protein
MLRVGAVDCEASKDLCKSNDITGDLPLYRVYPEVPIPHVDYRPEELDTDVLKKKAYKFIGNRSIEITSNNFETYVSDNVGKPKMLLIHEKEKTPIVYRSLSTHFDVSYFSYLSISDRKHSNLESPKAAM